MKKKAKAKKAKAKKPQVIAGMKGTAACGCRCTRCFCSEGACNVHNHCLKSSCDPHKLFHDLTGGDLDRFLEFTSSRFLGKRDVVGTLIKTFGKW
jgi:hypothetical protein